MTEFKKLKVSVEAALNVLRDAEKHHAYGPVTKGDLPQWLVNEVQKHTNTPWWNAEAAMSFAGSVEQVDPKVVGSAVDDLCDVIEMLREQKLYAESDRLRAITGRLAKEIPADANDKPDHLRVIARKWAA